MSRRLRVVGLMAAVLALTALFASSAQAGVFSVSKAPWKVKGVQATGTITGTELSKHEFSTKAGVVKCNTATFEGEGAETETGEVTLTPAYSGCTISGLGATVTVSGCKYLFTAKNTTNAEIKDTVTIETHVCPTGGSIVVKVVGSTCEVTVGQQTLPETAIEGHNNTFKPTAEKPEYMDITATIDAEKLKYTIANGSKCPNAPASGTYEDGTYKGVATISATNAAGTEHLDLTVT
jgi:hypothetical protein